MSRLKYLNPVYQLRLAYDWCLHAADHKHSKWVLAAVAFMEASFFLIPPEVVYLPMAAKRPNKALLYAGIMTICSVLGGLFGYWLGLSIWHLVSDFFLQNIFSVEKFEMIQQKFRDNAFTTIFLAGFTPIPFKVFTVAAGVVKLDLLVFTSGALVSRGLRYFIMGGMMYFFGEKVRDWVEKNFEKFTLISGVLLVALIYLLKVRGH